MPSSHWANFALLEASSSRNLCISPKPLFPNDDARSGDWDMLLLCGDMELNSE